ncbi:phosphopantetheine-binding protein [Mycobacterium kyorinense]|uniref:Phosphopantetheine-binding protein n=1 Tax=Mycobacterium kyorinense TaxID=487514 RepID=A0A1A2YPX4_9MYCO|nr:phosphopantetheine-binding protein [Mycobacterium kyorinense]OBI40284.1 phosphopantetheine-binding protein [Mycobacterium kyorinense]
MTTTKSLRAEVLSVLTDIAPEVDPAELDDDLLLRDQVDLDSMDWLNFLVGIHKRLHVDIPEADYASLRTLTDVVRYVEEHGAPENR